MFQDSSYMTNRSFHYTDVADHAHKNKIHTERHDWGRKLSDSLGQAMDHNIPEYCAIQPRFTKSEDSVLADKVREHDQERDCLWYARCNGRTLCTHRERKNEQPISEDIKGGRNHDGNTDQTGGSVISTVILQSHRKSGGDDKNRVPKQIINR